MASLQDLLSEEGFESRRQVKFISDKSRPIESTALAPIYICYDRRSSGNDNKHKPKEAASSRKGSASVRSNCRSTGEPAIDEVAIRAVVSILSGYIGRYLKDDSFREAIQGRCCSCLAARNKDKDGEVFANIQLCMESIQRLAENPGTKKEMRMKSLRNPIRLLSIVASLNSKSSRSGSVCGIPNSHISACAQLYLSIVYKLEKNERISARHLLQVFCDSPSLARTHLLPELWEHFFLPHLLHIKIWYSKELEFLSNSGYHIDKEKKMKALSKAYNDQMDVGTIQFALYYKEWLKVGGQAPPVPSVPLPSRPTSYGSSRRRSSESSCSRSAMNKSLYQAVFGPTRPERKSVDFDERNQALINSWDLEEEGKAYTHADYVKNQHVYAKRKADGHRRSSSKAELWPETMKSDYFRLFTCQSEPTRSTVQCSHMGCNVGSVTTESTNLPPSDLKKAITTICSSESLADSEMAIRVITKTWLDLHEDVIIQKTLSQAPLIEGMLEVLFVSMDDEILELTISILAELVVRNDASKHIILNSDPQLGIFMKLLRSGSLFLKAAILLYLVKPKAKQMISMEWIPLVLRVLEFGDQLQTLFAVQCSPQLAAYYLLEQLLTGFDEDKNLENARQVISIGGLCLLVKRIETGDICEKTKAVSIIFCCVRADGRCRHYLANNLNKGSILELLAVGKPEHSQWLALSLLTELLCLNRRTQAIRFLHGLRSGWGNLNTMHILFVYLQKARVEERPMVAAILLMLDFLGDPLKCSVYRQEAIEATTAALDCKICKEEVQEQSARALFVLGGHFSYAGEANAETWLLKEAGFNDNSGDSFHGKDVIIAELIHSKEEDEAMQTWQRKATRVLLNSGNKRLLSGLADSVANAIPCLARASLVTVSWMTSCLHSIGDENLQSMAYSILVPTLIELLNHDRAIEERVLASFSLLYLVKSSDCLSAVALMVKDQRLMGHLRNLSQQTWTARELISIINSGLIHPCRESEDPLKRGRKLLEMSSEF